MAAGTGKSLRDSGMRVWQLLLDEPKDFAGTFHFILLCFASLGLGVQHPLASLLAAAGCVTVSLIYTRPMRVMLWFTLPFLFIVFMTGSATLAALPLSLIASTASIGYLVTNRGFFKEARHFVWQRRLIPLPILVSYAAGALIARDPFAPALVLVPVLPALVMGESFLNFNRIGQTVVRGTAVLGAETALVCGIAFLRRGVVTLPQVGDFCRNAIADALRQAMATAEAQLEAAGAAGAVALPSEAEILNAATLVVNLLPGLFVAAMLVITYLCYHSMIDEVLAWNGLPLLPTQLTSPYLSTASAVLFLVATLAMLFAESDGVNLFGTVMRNLVVVLWPGQALYGYFTIAVPQEKKMLAPDMKRSCLSYLIFGGILALFFLNPGAGLMLIGAIGAVSTLVGNIAKYIGKKGTKS